jgi:hypothetical protein
VFVSGQALSATTGTFSGDVTLGSSVLATPTGSAPSYTCRAWVNFNGTGTVAIRASGNVSSITDNGTGDYTVNFTTAMPDANFSASVNVGGTGGIFIGSYDDVLSPRGTGFLRVFGVNTSFSKADAAVMNVSIFR